MCAPTARNKIRTCHHQMHQQQKHESLYGPSRSRKAGGSKKKEGVSSPSMLLPFKASQASNSSSSSTLRVTLCCRNRSTRIQLPRPLRLQYLLEVLEAELVPTGQRKEAGLIGGGRVQSHPFLIDARAHVEELLHLSLLSDGDGSAPISRPRCASHSATSQTWAKHASGSTLVYWCDFLHIPLRELTG